MAEQAHSLAGNRVWARRRRRAASLLLAISATVFVVAFCVSGIVGFGARSSLAEVRQNLSSADAAVTLRAPIATDAAAQDTGVRAVISRVFQGAPLTVTRTVSSSGAPVARWQIAPDVAKTTTADLGKLVAGFGAVENAVTRSKAARSSAVQVSGHGASTAQNTLRAVGALEGVELIPLTVLSIAGLVALGLARSLLTDYRRNETRFLRSRGGSGEFLTTLDLRESILTCLVGTVLGTVAAQAALFSIVGAPTDAAEIVVPTVVVFVVALAVNWLLAWLAARTAAGTPRSDAGRLRAAAPLTLCGFGAAIAVIAYWRFEQSATNGATFAADPSAILAPGALLAAGVLLCLLGAGQVAAGVESALSRGRGTRVFPVRSVNRSLTIVAGPTALLALAIGIATVTSAYSGTWQRFSADSQQLTTGGGLRATAVAEPVLSDASDLVPVDKYAAVPGVNTAALAARQEDTFGDAAATVVAVAPSALPKLLGTGSTAVDASALARELDTGAIPGVALPAHSTALAVAVTASANAVPKASDATVQVTLWLGNSQGSLFPLTLRAVPVSAGGRTPTTVTGAIPNLSQPWVIEAIDAGIATSDNLKGFTLEIPTLTATVAGQPQAVALRGQSWGPRDAVFDNGTNGAGTGIGFVRKAVTGNSIGNVAVRLMPTASTVVPVVITRPFAVSTGLLVGSRVSLDGQWASFTGQVRAIVAAVPGTAASQSLIAGLPALDRGWLATSEQIPTANEVWMASRDPNRAATEIASRLPSAAVTVAGASSDTSILSAATTALWIGAIGTSVFAIIALVAAVVALLRRRSIETFALRALGLRASKQAGLRRAELAILGLISLVVGAIVGAGVALLVATTMAQLSTPTAPGALSVRFEFDPVPLAVTLSLLLVAFLACWFGYGEAERRRAAGGRR